MAELGDAAGAAPLTAALGSPDPALRAEAAAAVARAHIAAAAPKLRALLQDTDSGARLAAASSLQALGGAP
jgi:HEAT repeat protein